MPNQSNVRFVLTRRAILWTASGLIPFLGPWTVPAYAAKASQGSVGYRDAPNTDKNCASCRLFLSPNACKSVDGAISPNGWCKIWRG